MIRYNAKVYREFVSSLTLDVSKVQKKSCYNVPCAFDIEASSFYQNKLKYACMYEWTFGLQNTIFYGRTWEEFIELVNITNDILYDGKTILYCYVHNLAYEFQFFKSYFEYEKIIAQAKRTPISVKLKDNVFEFRCSYMLSGKKLEKIADEDLLYHNTKKLVGELDYSILHTPDTELSDQELAYCENDVQILLDYIDEKIKYENALTKIPMTKTGYVRQAFREKCFQEKNYRNLMKDLILTPRDYYLAKLAIMGGFVHASCVNSNKDLNNVRSYDEKSAYPSMIRKKFPASPPVPLPCSSVEDIWQLSKEYCLILHLEFFDITDKIIYEHYISKSKCVNMTKEEEKEIVTDNGRIVSAKRIETFVTELDFDLINDFYKWKKLKIRACYGMRKSYLPKPIIESFLDFFEKKTELDGDNEDDPKRALDYMLAKGNLNSGYGSMVTDCCRESFEVINGNWKPIKINVEEALDKYNKSYSRFNYFMWGLYIAAHNRHVLLKTFEPMIINGDHVYSDTDSGKILHAERYKEYIDEVNKNIDEEMITMLKTLKIDVNRRCPKKPNGERVFLGFFYDEGESRFMTIGSKRYLTYKDGKLKLTISGVSKKEGAKYLLEKYKTVDKVFENFNDNIVFPAGSTGKLTHTYIDEPFDITVTDYQGHKSKVHENSYVHLEDAAYKMSIDDCYLDFLKGVQQIRDHQ